MLKMNVKILLISLFLVILLGICTSNQIQVPGGGSILAQRPMGYFTSIFSAMNTVGAQVTYDTSVGIEVATENVMMAQFAFAVDEEAPSSMEYQGYPDLQLLPLMVIPIVVVFNLGPTNSTNAGVDTTLTLSLDANTLVGIFNGSIQMWNDPSIASLNPYIQLPNENIRRVVRSDISGATFLLASYFSAVNPAWNATIGNDPDTIVWPNNNNYLIFADSPEALSRKVFTTPYSISYLSLREAKEHQHNVIDLKNAYGQFVRPSINSASSAVQDFQNVPFDNRFFKSLINGPGQSSWPIVGYEYLLYKNTTMPDCNVASVVLNFFTWIYTSPIASKIMTDSSFLPVDSNTQTLALARLREMKCANEFVYLPYQKHLRTGGIAFGFLLLLVVIIGVITGIIYAFKYGIQYMYEKSFYSGRISA
jgi:ABC-type phosphate transport system substrate-binding protein